MGKNPYSHDAVSLGLRPCSSRCPACAYEAGLAAGFAESRATDGGLRAAVEAVINELLDMGSRADAVRALEKALAKNGSEGRSLTEAERAVVDAAMMEFSDDDHESYWGLRRACKALAAERAKERGT